MHLMPAAVRLCIRPKDVKMTETSHRDSPSNRQERYVQIIVTSHLNAANMNQI